MPLGYIGKRLAMAIPTLFGVAVVVFVLLRVVPGDPIAMMLPPGARADDIERLRALYGLNHPIVEQFGRWLLDLVTGNFGTSISLHQGVFGLIMSRLPATLELALAALVVATAAGVLFGVAAAYWRGRWPEVAVDALTGLGMAIPDFLWALLLVLALGVLLPVLPISGRIDPRTEISFVTEFYLAESFVRGEFAVAGSLLAHMVLPVAALALPLTAAISRILKGAINEAMSQDYILMARVKGFSKARIVWREALRNALVPAVTLSGVQFTFLIGGTVLVERIFGYPGIGNMAIGAVIDRDLPLIQGIVLIFAVLFIVVNLLVDMTYVAINPRIRHG